MPKLNGGSESVSFSLPGWLIDLVDEACKRRDLNRSLFAQRAFKKYLADIAALDPDFWETEYQKRIQKS